MSKQFYITSPIYYVNGVPHIGTALTTAVCDFEKRYRVLRKEPVYFLTGTDENGTKVLEAAQAAGKSGLEFVDEISQRFVEEWKFLDIEYDDFIRTTEPRHIKATQEVFKILKEKGYVYLDVYEGWYDVSSESFVRDADVVDGKSPDGNELRRVKEENWFFKLSEFTQPLLEKIEKEPNWLRPESRKNEVIAFLKQEGGLRDMCISRSNQGWGIPVPGDESKVIYVWFDALINYLAATGWPDAGWEEKWPADVHWMAKEIFTRFHATLWPAVLMGLGLPLPKSIIAHGWFTFSGDKISKSKGGLISPRNLADNMVEVSGVSSELAVDVVRYALASMLPFEGDREFSIEEVERKYNADLANDLGNALNRTLSMAAKFVEGVVPAGPSEPAAVEACEAAKKEVETYAEEHRWDLMIDRAIGLVRFLNKYIDDRKPWALAKENSAELPGVIRSMLLCLRTASGLIAPVMHRTSAAMAAQMNLLPITDWSEIATEASLPAGTVLGTPEPMFPRIDPKVVAARQQQPKPAKKETNQKSMNPEANKPEQQQGKAPETELIGIEDFAKVQLRVARILEAETIEGSDKLLKLQVMIGEEKRQIVAGIRTSYAVEDLVGRQIVVVANLKPAKLRGEESNGMLLAATDADGKAVFLTPEREVMEGAKIK